MAGPDTVGSGGSKAAGPGTTLDTVVQIRFRVEVDGMTIGHFAECGGLTAEWETLEYAEGGNNEFVHQLRGRMRYRNLVLGRGMTSEDALLKWLFDPRSPSKRPTLTVAVVDTLGKDVRRFSFAGAYPVRWTGPELRAADGRSGLESLEIAHQGLAL